VADRYLLESGAPDGYLLEDGTGVLLQEDPPGGSGILRDEARILRWPQGDELPAQAATPCLDDSAWWGAMLVGGAIAVSALTPLPARGHQDEVPAAPVAVVVDDDAGWQSPPLPAPRAVVRVFDDAGDLPVAAAVAPQDEPTWQTPWVIAPTLTPLVWITGDELGTEAAPSVGGGGLLHDPIRLNRWFQDESLPLPATPLPVEDEYWQRPPIQPAVRDLRVWATTDEIEQTPATTRFEDDAFRPLLRVNEINGIVWATDDDLPRKFVQSEDYWFQLYTITAPPVLRVWQQQDERTTAATPLPIDENEWARPFSITPPRDLRLWATTDDIEQTPAALQVVDDDHWLAFSVPVAPRHTLWATDEAIVPAVNPAVPAEDYWQAPFSMRVQPIAWVGTHQDERATPIVPLEVDDDYWQKPPHIVPPFDLRIWSDDDPLVPYVAPTVTHGRRGKPIKNETGRSFTFATRPSNTSKTRRK
jgi:hypothetical protein